MVKGTSHSAYDLCDPDKQIFTLCLQWREWNGENGKSHFIVSTNIIFPCEDHKGFALSLLKPGSKCKTLCYILSPQTLGKICRLWLPYSVLSLAQMSSGCFGKLRLCIFFFNHL